jgi:large subunit ribosomal protein L30
MVDEENTAPKKAAKNPVKKAAVKKAATKKAAVKKAVAKQAAPKAEAKGAAETAAPKAAPKKAAVKKTDSAVKRISVTLVRSRHGRLASHKACVAGLGLRRMHQTVQVIDTPENRGMINKVQYLLNVEEA